MKKDKARRIFKHFENTLEKQFYLEIGSSENSKRAEELRNGDNVKRRKYNWKNFSPFIDLRKITLEIIFIFLISFGKYAEFSTESSVYFQKHCAQRSEKFTKIPQSYIWNEKNENR